MKFGGCIQLVKGNFSGKFHLDSYEIGSENDDSKFPLISIYMGAHVFL